MSQGLGANNATKDVKLGALTNNKDELGTVNAASVQITNNSSKRSDYFVTVALESPDGKSQLDTATVFVQNLESGQSKQDSASFLEASLGSVKVPAGARVKLQEVQRTEST